MSKQRTFNTYRLTFPEFIYDSYQYDVQPQGLHISFCFRLGPQITFRPTAFIPARPFFHPDCLSRDQLDALVFHIGMIELISYWKAYCPPVVTVRPFRLSEQQIAFWKKIYYNGLGEFFFTNQITTSYDDFLNFRFDTDRELTELQAPDAPEADYQYLVPIGGGKDSVVTLELLKQTSHDVIPLIMNPRGATRACIERAGYTMDDVLTIERRLDNRLLELNSRGALNGHTPFSAMLAFYTLLAAALTGKPCRIALSNENSANESTVAGSSVNHQYSKSLEFEDDFRAYAAACAPLQAGVEYFSFLRPLSELQIAMLFARHEHYHDVFRSCNVGSKQDLWCGHCAKCLFAFIILSPFIAPERLAQMFGKPMLDDETLRHEFDQLTGHEATKPFECVGTVSEVNDALAMTLARWYPDERPALLRNYQPQPLTTPLDRLAPQHNLLPDEAALLQGALLASPSSPQTAAFDLAFSRSIQFFNLLAFRRILIAGYGREGKSNHALLQRLFPRSNAIDIAHNDEEIIAALQSRTYDLILKSPGIPTALFDGRCSPASLSSQTDLFLAVYHDQTIGITGTKGKSTTASLIHHLLSRCLDRQVLLAGNIGLPLFDTIPHIDARTLIVAELSCHQLELLHRAPHIGLLLNLYQEHLDHYRSYDDYKMAKFQLALRQQAGDYFIYCADNAELAALVDAHRATLPQQIEAYTLDQALRALPDPELLPLRGAHNHANIYAATRVAAHLGIDIAQALAAMYDFNGLEHRLEYVATRDGIDFYNDSISTIPQTTIAALEALQNVETLILGGFDRGIDYSPLATYLLHQPLGVAVHNLVLVGSAGQSIWRLMEQEPTACQQRNVLQHFEADYSMADAVRFAHRHTASGKVCLLSPAASSYDHYKNFEARGADYKNCVNQL